MGQARTPMGLNKPRSETLKTQRKQNRAKPSPKPKPNLTGADHCRHQMQDMRVCGLQFMIVEEFFLRIGTFFEVSKLLSLLGQVTMQTPF